MEAGVGQFWVPENCYFSPNSFVLHWAKFRPFTFGSYRNSFEQNSVALIGRMVFDDRIMFVDVLINRRLVLIIIFSLYVQNAKKRKKFKTGLSLKLQTMVQQANR